MFHPIVKAKKEQMIEGKQRELCADGISLICLVSCLDRCSEIEKANRVLLERMTCILAGPGTNFPQHQKGYMPPIPAYQIKKGREKRDDSVRSRRTKAVTKSLN